ncbi:hypothetical protein ACFSQ7_24005 [Paenibacillus rhizoplanae]
MEKVTQKCCVRTSYGNYEYTYFFDGNQIIAPRHIVVKGESIISVGGDLPADATIIDGEKCDSIAWSY